MRHHATAVINYLALFGREIRVRCKEYFPRPFTSLVLPTGLATSNVKGRVLDKLKLMIIYMYRLWTCRAKVSRSVNLTETGWQTTPSRCKKKLAAPWNLLLIFYVMLWGVCAATSQWSLGIGVRGRVFLQTALPPPCVLCWSFLPA